jgi:hypothetical protein
MKTIGILNQVTATGVLLYWLGFFIIGLAPDNAPPGYLEYEHAFPLPDLMLAGLLFFSGWRLQRQQIEAVSLALSCAGALIFLGILDFSFNLQNGMYLLSIAELISNASINIWCVGYGAFSYYSLTKALS